MSKYIVYALVTAAVVAAIVLVVKIISGRDNAYQRPVQCDPRRDRRAGGHRAGGLDVPIRGKA
ncbi:MAG: hypothetical protein V8S72_01450 [Oscillospiraceae bacterium]